MAIIPWPEKFDPTSIHHTEFASRMPLKTYLLQREDRAPP